MGFVQGVGGARPGPIVLRLGRRCLGVIDIVAPVLVTRETACPRSRLLRLRLLVTDDGGLGLLEWESV